MSVALIPGRILGRNKPRAQFDYGHFRGVVGQDGVVRYFPRFGKHYNLAKDTTPPPTSVDWSTKAAQSIADIYLNDRYGCCVISSRYHQLGVMTGNESGSVVMASDNEVYNTYQSACGRGDNGCDMSAVNQYQQQTGIIAAGTNYKSDGSAAVDNTNQLLVQVCLEVFGGLNVGMNLPNTWYQSADGSDWGPVPGDNIVGGHEVQAFGYDTSGVWIATWGGKRRILWTAFQATTWIDELYTTLAGVWYNNGNLAPNGIDVTTLKTDLQLVANGQIPPLPGPTPPPVPPTPPSPPVPPSPVPPTPPSPPVPAQQSFSGSATLTGHIPLFGNITLSGPVVGTITSSSGRRHPAATKAAAVLAADGLNFNFAVLIDLFNLFVAVRSSANGKLAADLVAVEHAIASGSGVLIAIEQLLSDAMAVGTDPLVLAAVNKLLADLGITIG